MVSPWIGTCRSLRCCQKRLIKSLKFLRVAIVMAFLLWLEEVALGFQVGRWWSKKRFWW
jgi:hypothetical protein